jgi:hypothetical protein
MEREVVWRGRRYGGGGGMEREVVWRGRGYGEGGGMEREGVWRGRGYGEGGVKEKLTTLCGPSKEETELGFSRQRLGAGDAVLIANEISDMRAISSVNLLKNRDNAGEHVVCGILEVEDLGTWPYCI